MKNNFDYCLRFFADCLGTQRRENGRKRLMTFSKCLTATLICCSLRSSNFIGRKAINFSFSPLQSLGNTSVDKRDYISFRSLLKSDRNKNLKKFMFLSDNFRLIFCKWWMVDIFELYSYFFKFSPKTLPFQLFIFVCHWTLLGFSLKVATVLCRRQTLNDNIAVYVYPPKLFSLIMNVLMTKKRNERERALIVNRHEIFSSSSSFYPRSGYSWLLFS